MKTKPSPDLKSAKCTASIEDRIIFHANDMLWLWRELVNQDPDGSGWHERAARQAYQDALMSLQRLGLIESYDVPNVRVKVDGVWRADRREVKFVPSKQKG